MKNKSKRTTERSRAYTGCVVKVSHMYAKVVFFGRGTGKFIYIFNLLYTRIYLSEIRSRKSVTGREPEGPRGVNGN